MKHLPIYQSLALLTLLLTGCTTSATAAGQVRILPGTCNLNVGESIALALDGHIGDNALIVWQADSGSIAFTGQGLNAVYTAPQTSGSVNISAIITSGTPVAQSLVRTCTVSDGISSGPTTPVQDPTGLPTIADPPTSEIPSEKTVIISEVMANPCGGLEYRKWNEYVELYNYGTQPQDVKGWWLVVSGTEKKSNKIVSWESRNPTISLKQDVVTNSTIIPPGGFAVVLSPIYTRSLAPHKMPYRFPAGTVILTIAERDRIGHTVLGIVGEGNNRDALVLYLGGASSILEVKSTYGTPILSGYPQDIRDDHADNVPLDLHTCSSAERVNPLWADSFENWHEVLNGSPGEAPYP